jgi:hypothetical protein
MLAGRAGGLSELPVSILELSGAPAGRSDRNGQAGTDSQQRNYEIIEVSQI